ncbi:hypothetical protein L2E82_39113 [Cichorium intybus]|uniref:Uncharacterized protein n=1 Tax=Cichorium intybus TaxID=13427 RepID=A0ACB9AJ24_CICIN|nr:hypothetical protein L2E82_39113 [Cichorium intybus]
MQPWNEEQWNQQTGKNHTLRFCREPNRSSLSNEAIVFCLWITVTVIIHAISLILVLILSQFGLSVLPFSNNSYFFSSNNLIVTLIVRFQFSKSDSNSEQCDFIITGDIRFRIFDKWTVTSSRFQQ